MLAIPSFLGPHTVRETFSLVSVDVVITGSVHSPGDFRVDGQVKGSVGGQNLVIGDTAEIYGDVRAEKVVVRGKVEGSIFAKKITLAAGCQVKGQIAHQTLEVEFGAVIETKIIRYVENMPAQLSANSE
jgi:cytoskeletal protein CcmA (bactofilin family)